MKAEATKRISVIIPGYNTPVAWWRRCVASVLAACGPDDEVICVDDGSSPPVTPEWVFAGIDARVRLIRKANGGLPSARNAAMAIANGKYITFVDSDDEIRPGILKECVERLDASLFDISLYGVQTIWVEDGLAKNDVPDDAEIGELKPADILSLYKQCLFNYAWNKVYRRSFLADAGLIFDIDGVPCEDVIFNLRCVMAGAKWLCVPRAGYIYYRTGGTLLSKYKPTNVAGWRKASDTWKAYKAATPGAKDVLGALEEQTPKSLDKKEWDNIWRANSPFGVIGRWKFAMRHTEALGRCVAWVVIRKAVFVFLRRHCYVRPVRRWNIRRVNRGVFEWKGNK